MKLHSCALSCALALSAAPACAQEPARVVIEGARYDQRRDDTASTIVIKREELLRHGDRSLAEALARIPGVTVRAGQAGTSAIRLRGLGNGYTQVLLNGQNAPAGFAIESLSPELIERIDIVRTASAELGVQGIAGTVNIILRKSAASARRTAKIGIETERGHWSPALSADVADKGERFSYSLSGTLARTRREGFYLDLETASGAGPVTRKTQRSTFNMLDVASIAPRLNWVLDHGARLSAHGLLGAERRSEDGESRESQAVQASPVPHSVFKLVPRGGFLQWGLDWERPLASGATVQLEAGGNDTHRRSEFEFAGVPRAQRPVQLVSVRVREQGVHAGGKYRLALAGGHDLLFGWSAARSIRDQTRAGNDSGDPAVTRLDVYRGEIGRAAMFVQDDWQVNPAWSLSLGLRAEGLDTRAGEAREAPVRLRTRILSPIVQVLYKHGKSAQLRAGLTRTYKAPTLFALVPRRFVVDNNNNETNPDTQGNPGLRPEMAWGLDAGVDRYFGKDAMLGASVFVRRIDDVTVRDLERDARGWLSRQVNGGRAEASGMLIEGKLPLTLLVDVAPAVGARFSLARNHARVAGRATALDGQERASATVGLDYRTPDGMLEAGANLSYKAGSVMRWSDTVASGTGPVRTLDVSCLWNLGGGKRLRVGAVNLLQRDTSAWLRVGERSSTTLERKNTGIRLALEGVSK